MNKPEVSHWVVTWANGSKVVVAATSKFAAKKQAKRQHRIIGAVNVRPAKESEIPNADA